MSTQKKLTGQEAIDYAREHSLLLSKYGDPLEGPRDDVTPDEADVIARDDSSLIYLEKAHDTTQRIDGLNKLIASVNDAWRVSKGERRAR